MEVLSEGRGRVARGAPHRAEATVSLIDSPNNPDLPGLPLRGAPRPP